jgi:alpha-galactosidase
MRTLGLILLVAAACAIRAAETVPLTALDLGKMKQGWGKPQLNRSIREKPLAIAGRMFTNGVGTHANSALWINLSGGSDRFLASVGVDDAAGGPASVTFKIVGDGRKLWESGVMKPGQAAKPVDLDLKGLQTLVLLVGDAGDGIGFDHANWVEARFLVSGAKPQAMDRPVPRDEAVLLTPKPGPAPRVNGPRVYGCRPGNPFIYRVPTTGERPIEFSAQGLPATLRLDPAGGIITGAAPPRGEYAVTLRARNRHGEASRPFRIVAGDTLALTPPMGWNHWYTHYDRITDKLMREAADVMVSSGMADVGYQYVSIDDCWMNAQKNKDPLRVGPLRDAAGDILPNKHFPDMKGLTDYIHSKGLKAGTYTSPGPRTCAGFAGTWQHEARDAKRFADWGFDFLKYDWCSYGEIAKKDPDPELVKFKKPYQLMGDLLRQQSRDIVFNLCQYGMGNVWEWGAEVGGHCWRTAGDLGFELDRVFEVALKNAEHRPWSRPGAWNDPDYIQIGAIGNARGMGEPIPCPLTHTEQYAFMSLWCLMAAPLFYSGDMGKLDEFTVNVLCNPEVIEINQDPLGECARVIALDEDTFVMVKSLEDGGKAVGLGNRGEVEATVTAKWADLGLKGRQVVRDVWRHKDLGSFEGQFQSSVPRRGVVLVKMNAQP